MAEEKLKIFFDLDGTLIDVAPRHYRVYAEIAKSFGGVPLPQAEYWQLKRSKTKWPAILEKSNLNAGAENDFLAQFIQKIEQIDYLKIDKLFPDAEKVLAETSKHHECFLVSLRRNQENLLKQIEWLGLTKYFTKILTGHSETDGYDKKIELVEAELTKDGSGMIVGDTEADIVTGNELGLITVAILSGIRDKEFLSPLKPQYILSSIKEMPSLDFGSLD